MATKNQHKKAKRFDVKLASIFAIPITLVWAGFQQVRPLVSIFDEAELLESRLSHAKAAGFLFQESDFRSKPIATSQDAYYVIEKGSKDKALKYDQWKTINGFTNLDSPTVDTLSSKQIEFAHAVADRPQLDPRTDLYLNAPGTVACAPILKRVVFALTYEALHSARHGKQDRAVNSLRLAFKVVQHFRVENDNFNTSHAHGAQQRLYSSIVSVAHELRGNKMYLRELEEMLEIEPVTQDLFAELRLELFRICAAIDDFQGYEQFASSMIFVTGSDGCYTEAELNPKDDPFRRQPAQRPMFKEGLKSKAVATYLEFANILKREESLKMAGRKMDAIDESLRTGLFGDYLEFLVLHGREQYYALSRKPSLYRILAKWGVTIATEFGGVYPSELPSRRDDLLGGELRYQKVGKGFAVYSTGPDAVDNGGPWLENGKSNYEKGDDFGLFVKEEPVQRLITKDAVGRASS